MVHSLHGHHGISLLHFKINQGLKEMYASLSLRQFALYLVGIFVPIYFYVLGYPILDIILYFVLYHLFHVLISIFVAGKLARRFGVKHLMLFSMPFLFLQLILIALLEFGVGTPLWVLALILAFSNAMYWVGFHSEFSKSTDRKNRGKEASVTNVLASIVAALGPVIGGFIIVYLGYLALYILVLVVLVLAILPLFWSKDFSGKKKYLIRKVYSKRSIKKDYLSFIFFGITTSIFLALWPLIMHLKEFFVDESGLGIIFTITFVFGILLSIYSGRMVDRIKTWKTMFKISNVVFVFIWIGRWIANSIGFLVGTEFIAGLTRPFFSVSHERHSYDRAAKSKNVIEYVVFRESVLHFSAALALFFIWLWGDIFVSYFVAAGAHLLTLLI